MEEEEDTDGKKDEVERQHEGAEGSNLTSRAQAETSEDTDNKGAQDQGLEVFQMNSEIKVLEGQAQNENRVNGIKESVSQEGDSASNAGESSSNTGASRQEPLSHTEGAVSEDKSNNNRSLTTDISKINNNEGFKEGSSCQVKPKRKEPIYVNYPAQNPQAHDSEESVVRETTKPQVQIEEKDKKSVPKAELKHGSRRSLKQLMFGDRKKQIHTSESKQEGAPPLSQRLSLLSKGQKSSQTGKENEQKEGKEKTKSTSEANKIQQRKGGSEQKKTQSDQKLKTEEKQRPATKPGEIKKTEKSEEKLPAAQKEVQKSPSKKLFAHRKEQAPPLFKRVSSPQTFPKERQKKMRQKAGNVNAVKSNESKGITQQQLKEDCALAAKDQQTPPLPQSTTPNASLELQEIARSVSKESSDPLLKSEKESGKEVLKEYKGIDQQQTTEDSVLIAKNQENISLPQSTTSRSSLELQETAKGVSKESTDPLLKSEKESGKDVLKEYKGIDQQHPTEDRTLIAKNQEYTSLSQSTTSHSPLELQETEKIMSKESSGPLLKSEKESGKEVRKEYKEDQNQETNKLTEKKAKHEKKNEIKKQKQQHEAKQQLKQLKKENPQLTEHGNKIPHKSDRIKAPMAEKKRVSSAIRKQSPKTTKESREVQISTQKHRGTNAVRQQQEEEKSNRNMQNAVSKNSAKEDSSEDVIHNIRKQYQQLCKEELMQQHQSPQSDQPAQKDEKVQQQKPEGKGEENALERKENLNELAKKKYEDYEDDKGLGCGGMQGSSCPIYFGVRSYLHHFYDTTPVKNHQLYEEYTEEDDFEYAIDPVKPRGCRKCCQGFWFRAGLWGGINLILVGVITFLVGYLTPQREIIVGQQGDLEILDRSAIVFNHRLELCRLAGLAVFCCGGMVLFVVLFISTLLHVRGHYNNESICCTENIYYHGYASTPLVEPFIVPQDLTMPSTTSIRIPIIEEIKSVQPIAWPQMGIVREGSRVGQMP